MIFLTGDVHQIDRRMGDQKRLSRGWTEVRVCEPYLEIANKYSVCPTLMFTGLAIKREVDFVRSLAERFLFEIGGHTYSANRPRLLLGLSRRLLGLANGPYCWQRVDMSATLRCIRDGLGTNITSWRNHAYRTDRNTYRIAAELNIRYVSNIVTDVDGNVRPVNGILEVPINTLPDHESLGHDEHWRRCPSARAWVDQVLRQVEYQQSKCRPSVILAHPLCMFIEDKFAAFENLCRTIGGKDAVPLREMKLTSNNQTVGVG